MVLPPELVEEIIDNLAADLAALLACSLVARVWRPRALSHLFCTVRIAQPALLDPRRYPRRRCTFMPENFERLREDAPHLLLYIRHLIISVDDPYDKDNRQLPFLRSVSFPAPCAIETLKIHAYRTVVWSKGLFDAFDVRFPALRRLEVEAPDLFPLEDIANALSVAQELVLHTPRFRSSLLGLLPPEQVIVIPNLRSLELFNDPVNHSGLLFSYATSLVTCAPNLSRLAVRPIALHAFAHFLLESAGSSESIHELTLSARSRDVLSQVHIAMILERFPNLRVLEIEFRQEGLVPVRMPPPPATLASRALQEIRFTYRPSSNLYADRAAAPSPDWLAWDACVLSSDRMPAMRSVTFAFIFHRDYITGWHDRIGQLVKKLLPGTYSAGRLDWYVESESPIGQFGESAP
ncbi:hypothetical protein AURDEDRAFT_188188 [Auricularia subglabra TFB-10046 SS5]|uniref:F-box domain-containing protein n=1 Tax=Auricularia subglabra (strain TFB-10046 / SS5) TaxID=717982 RepID=J0DA47_AURST|nr:hypothetical protein AURDEDRAFT_188188 [Auricularia subglabra TFB-10046 SS5]